MATVFQVTYPSGVTGTVTATNPSVGTNGAVAPTSSTEIGVVDTTTGFLTPLTGTSVGGNEALNVNITGSVAPAGVATSANQTNGSQKTQIVDGSGNVIASTTNALNVAVTQPLPTGTNSIGQVTANAGTGTFAVSAATLPLPTGAATSANQSTEIASLASIDGKIPANLTVTSTRLLVDGSGVTQPISAATLPLPTGASTSALQTTGNSSLSSIDGKLNSLGQKTSAASVPVVIASDQSAITVTGTITATNSANGATGAAVPAQATQVGGSDGTNLRAIKVSATGVVSVDGSATTQPVSGTVAVSNFPATQPVSGTVTANIGTTGGITVTQGSTTSGQSGPLIQGAVTTAAPTYTTAQTNPLSLTTAGALRTDASATTQPVSGTVAATQSGTWNINNISGTVSLPTGAATETSLAKLTQTQGSTTAGQSGTLMQGAVTTAAPTYTTAQTSPLSLTTTGLLRVDSSSGGTQNVAQIGKSKANTPVRNDYTSTNVTTAAYVQLVASTTTATTEIEIFDSSGQTLTLAFGAAASEVNQINIFPGGNGRIPLLIPAGTRVSIKALSATASVGEIDINFYT